MEIYVYDDGESQGVCKITEGGAGQFHTKLPADFAYDPEDYNYIRKRTLDGNTTFYVDYDKKKTDQLALQSVTHSATSRASYLNDIDSEMKSVFNTTNRDKANALYLTWQLMLKEPQTYADKELKDETGAALNSETKVYDYASRKLDQVKAYSIYLMRREQTYKESLVGS